jgi:hypothetical protein
MGLVRTPRLPPQARPACLQHAAPSCCQVPAQRLGDGGVQPGQGVRRLACRLRGQLRAALLAVEHACKPTGGSKPGAALLPCALPWGGVKSIQWYLPHGQRAAQARPQPQQA